MQKWEYLNKWVWQREVEEATGERGLFGGEKKGKVSRWFCSYKGSTILVQDALERYGEEGWELVSAVVASTESPGGGPGSGWINLPHWLYFKRPKS